MFLSCNRALLLKKEEGGKETLFIREHYHCFPLSLPLGHAGELAWCSRGWRHSWEHAVALKD
jgi:hypothetical protein